MFVFEYEGQKWLWTVIQWGGVSSPLCEELLRGTACCRFPPSVARVFRIQTIRVHVHVQDCRYVCRCGEQACASLLKKEVIGPLTPHVCSLTVNPVSTGVAVDRETSVYKKRVGCQTVLFVSKKSVPSQNKVMPIETVIGTNNCITCSLLNAWYSLFKVDLSCYIQMIYCRAIPI